MEQMRIEITCDHGGLLTMKHTINSFWMLPKDIRKTITDSLLLSRDQKVIEAKFDNGLWTVIVRVIGDVRILWKDQIYKDASQYPDELTEFIRSGKMNDQSTWPENTDIINNNWYEVFIYDRNGDILNSGYCDIELPKLTEDKAKAFAIETLASFLKDAFIRKWIGNKYPGPEKMKESISDFFGKRASFCDSKIDDGTTKEDSDDKYVMKDSFELEDRSYIDFFYGDNTKLIGCIEFWEDIP